MNALSDIWGVSGQIAIFPNRWVFRQFTLYANVKYSFKILPSNEFNFLWQMGRNRKSTSEFFSQSAPDAFSFQMKQNNIGWKFLYFL